MTSSNGRGRRGAIWAIIGAVVLLAGTAAIIIGSLMSAATPDPRTSEPPAITEPSTTSPPSGVDVVDAGVSERGWVPEPITTDPEVYVHAALSAASTFDTTLSSREEWLEYLDTWFTPDTRYTTEPDQLRRMEAAQLEMRQGVVLPEQEWESLAAEDGRVVAVAGEDVSLQPVPDDPSGDMSIGTADVVLSFTRLDGSGAETVYDETVRVSVQVLCGPESVPTPGSAQQPGDCKVVRFFTEPMEP